MGAVGGGRNAKRLGNGRTTTLDDGASKDENIKRYFRRDKPFNPPKAGTMGAERPISYDFRDPVLNKEVLDAFTKQNQLQYRMQKDPIYAKKVIAQLKKYYKDEAKKV